MSVGVVAGSGIIVVALSMVCLAAALRVSIEAGWKALFVTAGAVGASMSIEGDIEWDTPS